MKTNVATIVSLAVLLGACKSEPTEVRVIENVHADAHALAVVERVTERLGGRSAWDRTRYLAWNFMGKRRHVWDKTEGRLRLEDGARIVLCDLDDGTGRVFENGVEVLDPEQRKKALERTRAIWINDSYWMFMPYKLLDPGVHLAYDGVEKLGDGRDADVLTLTFESVGMTPDNRYRVFVGRDTGLVEAWSYFEHAADAAPKFTLPWAGWKRFGDIWLATEHGQPVDWNIRVFSELPDSVFESPEPVSI
jgi:hypothetical protein